MIRRLPLVPTLLVLVAVAVMIRLGFWQLDRREEKHALIAHYTSAVAMDAPTQWPRNADAVADRLYRKSALLCRGVEGTSGIAGRNAQGEAGIAVTAQCRTDDGDLATVVVGWSREPSVPDWSGGAVRGTIAPGPRLIADPPLAGLEANAVPDPADLPDNHLAYAVQWFAFALTALVIYALAVRKRLARNEPPR